MSDVNVTKVTGIRVKQLLLMEFINEVLCYFMLIFIQVTVIDLNASESGCD